MAASVPARHSDDPLPIRSLPKGNKRNGVAIHMSRGYTKTNPNPSRIRIPKNSEERVFDADFLSKSSFSVPLATRNVVR